MTISLLDIFIVLFFSSIAIALFLIFSLSYYQPHRKWLLMERTLLFIGVLFGVFDYYYIHLRYFFIGIVLLLLALALALPYILTYRRRPTYVVLFLQRATLAYGYILFSSLYTTEALSPLLYANLTQIIPNGLYIGWDKIIMLTYSVYLLLYLFSAIASIVANSQKKYKLAISMMAAPLIPLFFYLTMWAIIGIKYLLTGHIQII